MKKIYLSGLTLALAAISANVPTAFAQSSPTQTASNSISMGYPEEVALSQEGKAGWVYRRFPGGQRLYFSDLDKDGKSVCNKGCDGAWTPVYAPPNSGPKGLWTVIVRDDGSHQWAYKGRPMYTLYHDDPAAPGGDGQEGVWHILPFTSQPESIKDLQKPR
jgi:predicted lipoprotein with Yx(FWY)xxD motif